MKKEKIKEKDIKIGDLITYRSFENDGNNPKKLKIMIIVKTDNDNKHFPFKVLVGTKLYKWHLASYETKKIIF